MVPHCMLEDHKLQCLLHLVVGELALVDEGCDCGVKGMDAFIGLLAHIQEDLILEVPEMVFGLYGGHYGIQYLPGGLLMLQGDGPIVNQSGGFACLCP